MISYYDAILPPRDIQAAITKQYHEQQLPEAGSGYILTGNTSYGYDVGPDYVVRSSSILRDIVSKAHRNTVNVLDIGTGDGQFVTNTARKKHPNVKCYGLTATDTRHTKSPDDNSYIIGNANRLLQIEALKDLEFDCIFSHMTFLHLVDPLGAIIQAYNKLKPGGWLFIDRIPLRLPFNASAGILSTWHVALTVILELRKLGHIVTARPASEGLYAFVIKKTDKELMFPFTYQNVAIDYNGRPFATYAPDAAIYFALSTSTIHQQYQIGQAMLRKKTDNYTAISKELNSTRKFQDLFPNPESLTALQTIYQLLVYTNYRFQSIDIASLLLQKSEPFRSNHQLSLFREITSCQSGFSIMSVAHTAKTKRSFIESLRKENPRILDELLHLAAMLDTIDIAMFDSNNIPFKNCADFMDLECYKPDLLNFIKGPLQPQCDTV